MAKITPWLKIKAEYLQGATPKELGKKYNLTAKQISDKANHEGWVKDKSEISEKIREITQNRINDLSNLALDTLENILTDVMADNSVKVQASRALIDISGLKSIKQEINSKELIIKVLNHEDEEEINDL